MKRVTPDDQFLDEQFDAEMALRPLVKVVKAAESTLTHVMRLLKSVLRGAGGAGSGWTAENGHVPGSQGGNEQILYHGTTQNALDQIKSEGLQPAWATFQKGHVLMTPSYQLAQHYAELRSRDRGDKPLILEVRIPAEHLDKMIDTDTNKPFDEQTIEGTMHVQYAGTVPGSWISAVYELGENGKLQRRELAAGQVVYAVVFVREGKAS
jgi:hypothetical protein